MIKLYVLQLKSQSVKTKDKPYIKVNIRELNRVSSTKCLSYIYWANSPYYNKSSLL